MQIIISNSTKEPIYEQITKQIKSSILSGDLKEGAALPSIRQLAKDLQVSVITTMHADRERVSAGFTYTIVGEGLFEAGQNLGMIKEKKLPEIEKQLSAVIINRKEIGLPLNELQQLLQILYEERDD